MKFDWLVVLVAWGVLSGCAPLARPPMVSPAAVGNGRISAEASGPSPGAHASSLEQLAVGEEDAVVRGATLVGEVTGDVFAADAWLSEAGDFVFRRRAAWRRWAGRTLQSGDLVFTRGNHYVLFGLLNFSELSTTASRAEFSHVGIVAVEDGCPYVYDVSHEGVARVPFASYVTRSGCQRVAVRRLRPEYYRHLPEVLQFVERQRRRAVPFDKRFSPGNEALYCTELIAAGFTEAGLEVCQPTRVRDLPGLDRLHPWLLRLGTAATGVELDDRLYAIGNSRYGLFGSSFYIELLSGREVERGPPRG